MNEERRVDSLNEILYKVGEIGGKMDGVREDVKKLTDKVAVQNGRINKLEGWRTGLIMVFSFGILIVSLFGNFIMNSVADDRWRRSDHEKFALELEKKFIQHGIKENEPRSRTAKDY